MGHFFSLFCDGPASLLVVLCLLGSWLVSLHRSFSGHFRLFGIVLMSVYSLLASLCCPSVSLCGNVVSISGCFVSSCRHFELHFYFCMLHVELLA